MKNRSFKEMSVIYWLYAIHYYFCLCQFCDDLKSEPKTWILDFHERRATKLLSKINDHITLSLTGLVNVWILIR